MMDSSFSKKQRKENARVIDFLKCIDVIKCIYHTKIGEILQYLTKLKENCLLMPTPLKEYQNSYKVLSSSVIDGDLFHSEFTSNVENYISKFEQLKHK